MRPDDKVIPSLLDQQGQGGLSPYKSNYKCSPIKRTWHWCPRCMNKTVDRDHRTCRHCGGYLLFNGDDAKLLNETHTDWWMWYRSVFNFTGWYHSSFFCK